MAADRKYLEIDPRTDWRRSIFQLTYICYDEKYRRYVEDAQPQGMSYADYRQHTSQGAAGPLDLGTFDVITLSVAAFALLSLLFSSTAILKMIFLGRGDGIVNIMAAMTVSNVLYVVAVALYVVTVDYDSASVNWLATASICFSSWCQPPALACALVQVYTGKRHHRVTSVKMARVCLLVVAVLACLTPVPGNLEQTVFTAAECADAPMTRACVSKFRLSVGLQTTLVPLLIFVLPFTLSAVLLVCALNCHKSSSVADGNRTEEGFGETAVQATLTGIWFIILHFPTVMLFVSVRADDEIVTTEEEARASFRLDYERLIGSTGIMRTALIFRLINGSISFYVNLLCGRKFRAAFVSALTFKKPTGRVAARSHPSTMESLGADAVNV